jgi:hypothetical protein
MVCLRNISVDTLHKGDTEDNNNNNNKDDCNKIIFSCVQLALVRQTGYLQFGMSLKSVLRLVLYTVKVGIPIPI